MTIVHDVTNEKLLIKSLKKRPGAFKEVVIYDNEENLALPFPKILNDYNQGMGGCDIHSYLISVYTTARIHLRI